MKYVLLIILVLTAGVFGGAASDRVLSVITSNDREPQERINTDTSEDFFGVYRALVTDNRDPEDGGRVKIRFPWVHGTGDREHEDWVRIATLMAGNNRGSFFIPEIGDEVLVAFEAGDPRRPYVIGALWSSADAPPVSMAREGGNYLKMLRSRNGIQITMDDTDGQESLTLETPGGQKVILKDTPASIELINSNGNNVKMEASNITVASTGKVTISASAVEVNAGSVTVNAGMSAFSGVVKADTVIANAVISSVYSPGAGK